MKGNKNHNFDMMEHWNKQLVLEVIKLIKHTEHHLENQLDSLQPCLLMIFHPKDILMLSWDAEKEINSYVLDTLDDFRLFIYRLIEMNHVSYPLNKRNGNYVKKK